MDRDNYSGVHCYQKSTLSQYPFTQFCFLVQNIDMKRPHFLNQIFDLTLQNANTLSDYEVCNQPVTVYRLLVVRLGNFTGSLLEKFQSYWLLRIISLFFYD